MSGTRGLLGALGVVVCSGLAVVALAAGPTDETVTVSAQGVADAPVMHGQIRLAQTTEGVSREDLLKKLEEMKKKVKELSKQDSQVPEIRVNAPAEADAVNKTYVVEGFVGDRGSQTMLTLNGEPVELLDPPPNSPFLGIYTNAFKIEVPIAKDETEHRLLFEAVDQNNNSIAKEVVVKIIVSNRPKFKGKYYALIIGNARYDFLDPVKTAEIDANAVADVLERRFVFDEERITVLLNATRRDMLGTLSKLRKVLKSKDRLLIFYAGRGLIDDVTSEGFWQGIDAEELDDFTWIAIDDVRRNLRGLPARHVLVIADSVFPVAVQRGSKSDRDRFFSELDSYVSRNAIISGGAEPISNEISGAHSVFTHFLLEILENNEEPYITSRQLFEKLQATMTENSDLSPERVTVPDTGDEGFGDFTFILRVKPIPAQGAAGAEG